MANPAKAKGTRWESAIVGFLRGSPLLNHARRTPPAGAQDLGDIHVEPFCLQAKAVRSFALSEWVKDAEAQAERAGLPYGVAVVKAPRKPTARAYVVMSLETFRRLAESVRFLEAGR